MTRHLCHSHAPLPSPYSLLSNSLGTCAARKDLERKRLVCSAKNRQYTSADITAPNLEQKQFLFTWWCGGVPLQAEYAQLGYHLFQPWWGRRDVVR